MDEPIYLDYNATTPIAPEVIEAMLPALRDGWGNPSSPHLFGLRARTAVERAREQTAGLLGCSPDEIIFTSGGTESDNAAIIGIAEACADRGRHIVISCVEHPAVDAACAYLEKRGWAVTRVAVDGECRVDTAALEAALRPETALISVMHAHNETGTLQPIAEIGAIARSRGIVFHTDAAQTVGKVATRMDELNVDALTVAAHKFYGPKGVGALCLRRGTPFGGFLRGGGHEGGRRSGTENTPQIVGLGSACELASSELPARTDHMRRLRDRLETELRRRIDGLVVHASGAERLPNTAFVAVPGARTPTWLRHAPGVATAGGSACEADRPTAPASLLAMGVPQALALCSLRLTVGRPTTEDEIDSAAEQLADAARQAVE